MFTWQMAIEAVWMHVFHKLV